MFIEMHDLEGVKILVNMNAVVVVEPDEGRQCRLRTIAPEGGCQTIWVGHSVDEITNLIAEEQARLAALD